MGRTEFVPFIDALVEPDREAGVNRPSGGTLVPTVAGGEIHFGDNAVTLPGGEFAGGDPLPPLTDWTLQGPGIPRLDANGNIVYDTEAGSTSITLPTGEFAAGTNVITLLDERVAAVRAKCPQLGAAVIGPWCDEPVLFRSRAGRPWMLLPAEQDPMRGPKGEPAIPRANLAQLERISETGVDFDRIAIGHELDPGKVGLDLLGRIPPTGVRCDPDTTARLVGTTPPPPGSTRRWADKLDRMIAATATGPSRSIGAGAVDPIIFGVLGIAGPPLKGQPAAFITLTAWEW